MYNFYRIQMEISPNPDGTYERENLELCWKRPVVDENGEPKEPYVEMGIFNLKLSEYPELKALIEQATALAVPFAVDTLNNPPIVSEPIDT